MNGNWVSAFDMMASSGVIDFDAPAYILDQPSRYVGHPQFEDIPTLQPLYQPHNVKLKDLPQNDNFNPQNKDIVKNPQWKKTLFGGLLLGGAIALGFNIVSKGKIKIPENIKHIANQVIDTIKKPMIKLAKKICKCKP